MSDLLGKPIVIIPYSKPGCLARLWGFLSIWLLRGLFAAAWFALGYGCAAVRQ